MWLNNVMKLKRATTSHQNLFCIFLFLVSVLYHCLRDKELYNCTYKIYQRPMIVTVEWASYSFAFLLYIFHIRCPIKEDVGIKIKC